MFCSRCRRAADVEDHVRLCGDCGETLQPRGYCPICETYLNQQIGTNCPKHDVDLEAGPPASAPAELGSRNWVTLGSYPSRSSAEGLRIRLEAEGIPTFIDGERMGSAAMYQVATGGVKLQVPEDSLDEARILASQVWAPIDDPDDLEDAWDDLAPEPGIHLRTAMELVSITVGAVILLFLIGAAAFWLLSSLPV